MSDFELVRPLRFATALFFAFEAVADTLPLPWFEFERRIN
jgi:hypothetical protein